MKRFIQRFADKITGVLSGFDRLVFRGGLRPLTYTGGMKRLLWKRQVWIGDFGDYAQGVTEKLKEATAEWVDQQQRPLIYLSSSKSSKETLAREIAQKDGIREGLIAVFSCVEPCRSYEVYRNRDQKRLELRPGWRKCLFFYHYWMDPEFGFMNGRIQTWLPFSIQFCLNGREWLSRQMDEAGIGYRRLENKFVWIEDLEAAQRLMDRQLETRWPQALDRLSRMLNPAQREIFEGFPVGYYWTGYQTEWATDVMFHDAGELARTYPALAMHAMQFSSGEMMRFLGRKVNGNFLGEIRSEFK